MAAAGTETTGTTGAGNPLDRAREALASFLAEREREGDVACAHCGEVNPATFELCWKCGGAL